LTINGRGNIVVPVPFCFGAHFQRGGGYKPMGIQEIRKQLRALADTDKARVLQGFFKTGPGEYGEGDVFVGITVPILRKLAKEHRNESYSTPKLLLRSKIHEERLLALLMFINMYTNGDNSVKKKIYTLYRSHTRYINNWDLVDLSAPNIIGHYLFDKSTDPLYIFAKSPDLWKKRIAIISTFYSIRQNDFSDTLKISRLLMRDEHDLIHKAVGWMLREVGKRDLRTEEQFLLRHYKKMPRTMLRYAIERFPERKRKQYLFGTV
jgi:3-methyladenine DNA glycosylase AlkD